LAWCLAHFARRAWRRSSRRPTSPGNAANLVEGSELSKNLMGLF
jgi:hypothetical protein